MPGLALWNGRDPILKERAFGLTGPQGNHGEDVKEYWWYLDAVPSHAWNRWRYHYPQGPYPYQDLIDTNARRGRYEPEYELLDTGAFGDDRYWITEVHYAKASPDDLLMAIQVTNAGPEAETIHVLPTAWFRNTWSWGDDEPRPELRASGDRSVAIEHPFAGTLELLAAAGPGDAGPQLLFCENETNFAGLYGGEPVTPYPKDGINDHVIHGAATVNPVGTGTKCAFWYQVTVPAGQTAELRLRLRPAAGGKQRAKAQADPLGKDFDQVMAQRKAEADEFYAELTPARASADEALVLRQASAGMLWSKQLFYYDVARWLDGDPGQPAPPAVRKGGRNSRWRNFDGFDIISMPDKWEYPWFAAWDLAFHTVTLAHLDPAFAKYQLILICREWFQHPQGALPAYEWDFGDVNPPVHAWAALQVWAIDGGRDLGFPGPDLRQAAGQLHLVGEPGRRQRQQCLRGRLPRPGQHRPDRPVPPARRLHPGTIRRDRLDGRLRAGAGHDRGRAEPVRPAAAAPGSGAEVHGAFRRASAPRWTSRACGMRPTGCSTTGWSPRPGTASRSRCTPWSGSSPRWPPGSSTVTCCTRR